MGLANERSWIVFFADTSLERVKRILKQMFLTNKCPDNSEGIYLGDKQRSEVKLLKLDIQIQLLSFPFVCVVPMCHNEAERNL